jgi:hypothetical protein
MSAQKWYIDYLAMMYSIMKSSVPLMQTAYLRCTTDKSNELNMKLGDYLDHHIKEELDHDEWLLDDLEVIGVSRVKILNKVPLQEVSELVGSQYYWINHWHPVVLLGYIAFLEGDPPTRETIESLKINTGFHDSAFRTLVKHSDLDIKHLEDLNHVLDNLPINPELESLITINALNSLNKFTGICQTFSTYLESS